MLNEIVEVFEAIYSYADIGSDEPESKKDLLPMETFYLAVILVIFYYKLFVTIGLVLFDWVNSTEVQNHISRTLALEEEPLPRVEISPRYVRKSRSSRRAAAAAVEIQ